MKKASDSRLGFDVKEAENLNNDTGTSYAKKVLQEANEVNKAFGPKNPVVADAMKRVQSMSGKQYLIC